MLSDVSFRGSDLPVELRLLSAPSFRLPLPSLVGTIQTLALAFGGASLAFVGEALAGVCIDFALIR